MTQIKFKRETLPPASNLTSGDYVIEKSADGRIRTWVGGLGNVRHLLNDTQKVITVSLNNVVVGDEYTVIRVPSKYYISAIIGTTVDELVYRVLSGLSRDSASSVISDNGGDPLISTAGIQLPILKPIVDELKYVWIEIQDGSSSNASFTFEMHPIN